MDTERLIARAQVALDLVHRLARPCSEAPARLANNVENDPLWQVRLANLKALEDRYSDSKELKNVALTALEEESPAIRLVAGRHAGSEGYAVLLDLVSSSATPESIRVEAIEFVSSTHTDEKASRSVLETILKDASSPHTVRLAAISGLGDLCDLKGSDSGFADIRRQGDSNTVTRGHGDNQRCFPRHLSDRDIITAIL